jgi:hypothetical protein
MCIPLAPHSQSQNHWTDFLHIWLGKSLTEDARMLDRSDFHDLVRDEALFAALDSCQIFVDI